MRHVTKILPYHYKLVHYSEDITQLVYTQSSGSVGVHISIDGVESLLIMCFVVLNLSKLNFE